MAAIMMKCMLARFVECMMLLWHNEQKEYSYSTSPSTSVIYQSNQGFETATPRNRPLPRFCPLFALVPREGYGAWARAGVRLPN